MSPFKMVDAHSAAEAVALLQALGPRSRPIAAGGDLLGLLKDGIAGPSLMPPQVLVNLATAADLSRIDRAAGYWRLGAMATLDQLAAASSLPPIIAEVVAHIASPQLRARTTLAGNLLQRPRCMYFRHPDEICFKKGGNGCPALGGPVQAYPGSLLAGPCHAGHPSDLAPALMALGAKAVLCGPNGLRHVTLSELFRNAAHQTDGEAALKPYEILSSVHVDDMFIEQAFEKIAPRDANEFATASAAIVGASLDGKWSVLRIALGGVAPGPLELDTDDLIGTPVGETDALACMGNLLPPDLALPISTRLPFALLAIDRALARIKSRLVS